MVLSVDPAKFTVFRGARRIWAVAAIHGDRQQLGRVHDAIERRFEAGDRLVYLGNFMGCGSQIRETIDELLLFRRALMARFMLFRDDIVYLRGGQEEMWHKLAQLHLAQAPAQVLEWMLAHGAGQTLSAYGSDPESVRYRCREGAQSLARWTGELRGQLRARPGHDQLLSTLRRAALTENGTVLFVHAGVDPARTLDDQGDSLWWGGRGFDAIDRPFQGIRKVIRGYDPSHRGVIEGEVAITVDGNCGFGGTLGAMCFDNDGEIVDRVSD